MGIDFGVKVFAAEIRRHEKVTRRRDAFRWPINVPNAVEEYEPPSRATNHASLEDSKSICHVLLSPSTSTKRQSSP